MRVLVTAPDDVAAALQPLETGGAEVLRVGSTEEALRRLDGRRLAVLVAGEGSDLGSLSALPPAARRRLVVVLVGGGVSTGDWLGAFVRGVNLTVNTGDLANLPRLVQAAVYRRKELAALVDEEPLQ